jgi:hypothetical protein
MPENQNKNDRKGPNQGQQDQGQDRQRQGNQQQRGQQDAQKGTPNKRQVAERTIPMTDEGVELKIPMTEEYLPEGALDKMKQGRGQQGRDEDEERITQRNPQQGSGTDSQRKR